MNRMKNIRMTCCNPCMSSEPRTFGSTCAPSGRLNACSRSERGKTTAIVVVSSWPFASCVVTSTGIGSGVGSGAGTVPTHVDGLTGSFASGAVTFPIFAVTFVVAFAAVSSTAYPSCVGLTTAGISFGSSGGASSTAGAVTGGVVGATATGAVAVTFGCPNISTTNVEAAPS